MTAQILLVLMDPEPTEISPRANSSLFFPLRKKFQILCLQNHDLQSWSFPVLHFCMKVLGLRVVFFEAVWFAQFHSRLLQQNIHSLWDKSVQLLNTVIRLVLYTRLSLAQWLRNMALECSKILHFHLLEDPHNGCQAVGLEKKSWAFCRRLEYQDNLFSQLTSLSFGWFGCPYSFGLSDWRVWIQSYNAMLVTCSKNQGRTRSLTMTTKVEQP